MTVPATESASTTVFVCDATAAVEGIHTCHNNGDGECNGGLVPVTTSSSRSSDAPERLQKPKVHLQEALSALLHGDTAIDLGSGYMRKTEISQTMFKF